MAISANQRFTRGNACPICAGFESARRGQQTRCHGFLSSDGEYAHCTREEYAGTLRQETNGQTFAHRLVGDCRCGVRHDPSPPPTVTTGAHKPRISATYDYRDADDTLAYQVIRKNPKGFSQRQLDVNGEWVYNVQGVTPILYRLPQVLAADHATPVYITEGEKDADRLAAMGYIATTNAGGANKWREEYAESLRGRHVVILPDNDDPGREHGEKVARSLLAVAASVRVLTLPNLPAKGDVSDWLAADGDAAELDALTKAAPLVDARFAPKGDNEHPANTSSTSFTLTRLADLLREPVEEAEWVVKGILPTAGTSLIVAKPKVGKTTLVRNLALDVSRGNRFLNRETKQGSVIYLALEEKRGKVQEHFGSLGATIADQAPLFVHVGSAPQNPMAQLRTLIDRHHPVLVIIDPLQRFMRLKDGNSYTEVTTAMEPINDLARESGAHIVLIHHANKNSYGGGDSVLGSTGFFAGVDTLITLRDDRGRSIETTQRYGDDLSETALLFDVATGRVTLGASSEEGQQHEVAGAIRAVLRKGTQDETAIRKAVGGDQRLTSKELRVMFESGEVTRSETGKKGHPYLYSLAMPDDKATQQDSMLDGRFFPKGNTDHRASGDVFADTNEEMATWVG